MELDICGGLKVELVGPTYVCTTLLTDGPTVSITKDIDDFAQSEVVMLQAQMTSSSGGI